MAKDFPQPERGGRCAIESADPAGLPQPTLRFRRRAWLAFQRALDPLADEPQLAGYAYLAAARADFLRRLGRVADARVAYDEALLLTDNEVEREFLAARLAEISR